jgi:hypothetical protein
MTIWQALSATETNGGGWFHRYTAVCPLHVLGEIAVQRFPANFTGSRDVTEQAFVWERATFWFIMTNKRILPSSPETGPQWTG